MLALNRFPLYARPARRRELPTLQGGPQLLHALSIRLYLLTRRENGQTMAEYAIVLAVISIGVILALTLLGGNIKASLSNIASKV
jgi:Flp pilus assembly pilin Flp